MFYENDKVYTEPVGGVSRDPFRMRRGKRIPKTLFFRRATSSRLRNKRPRSSCPVKS